MSVVQGDRGWLLRLHQVLPGTALRRPTVAHLETRAPPEPVAWACLVGWPALLLAAGALVLARRDV